MSYLVNRRSLLAMSPLALTLPSLLNSQSALAFSATPVADDGIAGLVSAAVEAGMPGVVATAWFSGEAAVTAAAGVANLETATPVTTADQFRIYSNTKTFTAIVALQLVEEGLIGLDTPILDVLDVLDDPAVARIPHIEVITFRQVLNHSSGIYDYVDDAGPFFSDAFLGPEADWSKMWRPEELLAYADGSVSAPYFAPGEGSHYSNTNYILVGMVIERLTGSTFGDEVGRRILTPLGLHNTYFAAAQPAVEKTVSGYQSLDGQLVDVTAINLTWAWTAGGMVSTVGDLALFADAALSGSLLTAESFAEMTAFSDGATPVEGMGMYGTQILGRPAFGMDGESAGFSSSMITLPDEKLTVVLMTNVAPGGEPFERLRDQIFAWMIDHRA